MNTNRRIAARLPWWRRTHSPPVTPQTPPAASTTVTSRIPVVAAHAVRENAGRPVQLLTLCPQPNPTRTVWGHGAAAPHLPMLTAAPCRTDSAFPMAGRTGGQRSASLAPRVRSCRPPRPAPPPPTTARGRSSAPIGAVRGLAEAVGAVVLTAISEGCSSGTAASRAWCFGCAGGGHEAARGLLCSPHCDGESSNC